MYFFFFIKVWWVPSLLPSLYWAALWWSGLPGTPQASWEVCPPWPCVLPVKSSSTWAARWLWALEWSLPPRLVSVVQFNIVLGPTYQLYVFLYKQFEFEQHYNSPSIFLSVSGSMFLPPTSAFGAGLYSVAIYGGLVLFSMFLLYDTQKVIKRAETHPVYGVQKYDPINA